MSWFHVDVEVLFGTFRRRPLPTICFVEKKRENLFSLFSLQTQTTVSSCFMKGKIVSCLISTFSLDPRTRSWAAGYCDETNLQINLFHQPPLFASWLFICCSILRPFLSEEQCTRLFTWTLKNTTLSNGYLGSRNDEERSEMRYVMRIAEFSESSNLWTQIALLGSPRSTPLSVSVQQSLSSVFGNLNVFYIFSFLSACWLDNESLSIFPFIGK